MSKEQDLIEAVTYGVAPESFHHDDVVTALELWRAMASEFDPNDVWTIDEICPLLRTFVAVLTNRRAVLARRDAEAGLIAAVET